MFLILFRQNNDLATDFHFYFFALIAAQHVQLRAVVRSLNVMRYPTTPSNGCSEPT